MSKDVLKKFVLDQAAKSIIDAAPSVIVPKDRNHLLDLATNHGEDVFEVNYDIPGIGVVKEATVTKCKNGASVNYPEPYMRRRDPECMVIGDDKETDKVRYEERYGEKFTSAREEAFDWLKEQDLIVMPFVAGDWDYGYDAMIIGPKNAAFFIAGLADLQGFYPAEEIKDGFKLFI